jgi:hypothetical protein
MQKNKSNSQARLKSLVDKEIRRNMKSTVPLKYVDTPLRSFPTTAGTFINLNLPGVQGTANGQRTGDEIEIDRIEVRDYQLYGDTPVNTILSIYFQSKGSTPLTTISLLLGNDFSGYPGITSQYQTFIEKTGIRIMKDKTTVVCQNGSNAIVTSHWTMKPSIARIAFEAGATTVVNGQTQLFLISDSAAIPNPTYVADVRIYYRDV